MLKPENLIRLFDPDFSFDKLLSSHQRYMKGESILETMSVFILALAIMMAVILSLSISLVFCMKKADKLLKKIKEGFFWNGVYRSILIAYLPQLETLSK